MKGGIRKEGRYRQRGRSRVVDDVAKERCFDLRFLEVVEGLTCRRYLFSDGLGNQINSRKRFHRADMHE